MILQIDREKKVVLLKWLKQGFIDTLDLPDAYKDGTLFFELLQQSSMCDQDSGNTDDNSE